MMMVKKTEIAHTPLTFIVLGHLLASLPTLWFMATTFALMADAKQETSVQTNVQTNAQTAT
jgi:hypothetical protein